MPVVSVSLSDENLAFLDKIQEAYKLKGRSDAVRTSIQSAISEMQDMENMTGPVEGILITVLHDHADPCRGAQGDHTGDQGLRKGRLRQVRTQLIPSVF